MIINLLSTCTTVFYQITLRFSTHTGNARLIHACIIIIITVTVIKLLVLLICTADRACIFRWKQAFSSTFILCWK